ncbi:hypothetical protein AUK40_05280 [Candidatus Wirthbacteria bacterium CG2_30_54_11]|uniref:Uncharacterized protein n=1 Tax=Candidatus Wirthbacteria bacterium CG2_30_54_11 TaxID=1817892 RepID=A0A1J5IGC6_9BACT|nr:MAG: hypothetical protein AUK40_05280 [Candidatus Wirthbacteria bacterium CG2_30_54_11]
MLLVKFFQAGFSNLIFFLRTHLKKRKLIARRETIRHKIAREFQSIGEAVYQKRGDIASAESRVQELGHTIADLESLLLSAEQDLTVLTKARPASLLAFGETGYVNDGEKSIRCRFCKTTLSATAHYCAVCGKRLLAEE